MSEQQPIRVMIVDDHLLVRDGLNLLLSTFDEIEVVGLAEDGQEAITLYEQARPDVILMDIVMPNMDGPTATAKLRQTHPHIKVVALTSFVDEEHIQRAISAGAISYLLKNASAEQLTTAIQDAVQGRATFDPAVAQVLVQSAMQPPSPGHDLTPRELEVLVLLVDGKRNKDIAAELTVSLGTVRVYVSNILGKLGANNRTEAVSLALQHNLISKKE